MKVGKNSKPFSWFEYLLLLSGPLLSTLALVVLYGYPIVKLFFASMIVGFVFEYGLGYAYHKTLNKRLWTYSRLSINGYTSWLTLPMWGFAGIVFWALIHTLNV